MAEKLDQKYHIFTIGCQMNISDSERLESVLKGIGWKSTNTVDDANLIVVNSCAVRQKAMDRIYGRLGQWNKMKQKRELKTLLTGCVLEEDKKRLASHFDCILPISDLAKLPKFLGYDELVLNEYFDVTPEYNSKICAYVPIMTGCDKFCTFCAVPYTRGREISRPYNDILREIESLANQGYKEIVLLGQNVNSFVGAPDRIVAEREVRRVGKQIINLRKGRPVANNPKLQGTINFPELLQKICNVEGDFWVWFTSCHPYDMSDELIDVMARNDKIRNYLNLPVQSGSDTVLRRMNRYYTVEHYLDRIKMLRKKIPDIAISTDIIVGFCGETEAEFEATAELFREAEYYMAYLSQYSTRPGTVADKLFEDDVSKEVKKDREEALNDILKETGLRLNKEMVGKRVRVLVDKVKEIENGLFENIGKSYHYKTVRIKAGRSFVGEFVDVEITKAESFGLEGIVV